MKIITIIILILYSNPSTSKYWKATKELPYELRALIESLNPEYLTVEEQTNLSSILHSLDGLIAKLPQSDRYFLGKSSIYKWILQTSSSMPMTESFKLGQLLDKKDYSKLSEFSQWLLGAIRSDIIEITKDPEYLRYISEKKNNKFSAMTKTIRRKIKLVAPWAYLLAQKDPMQINLQLMRYQMELIQDVLEQYKSYFLFSSLKIPGKSSKLTFFSFIENDIETKGANHEKGPLNYLDTIIEKHQKEGLPLPQNDWAINPQDSWSPEEGPAIELNVETDGSYVAPKNLPQPVDDWILEY